MRINGQGSVNGANMLNAYQKAGKTVKNEAAQSDSVELSTEAKRIAQLQKQASSLPEVREDLVRELKQKIASNTYEVSAQGLADKLLGEIAKEKK